MCPALSSQLILGFCTIPLVNEMEGLQIVNILLWTWNSIWISFADTVDLPLPFEAFVNYLGGVEVGKSRYEIVVRPNYIAQQGLIIMLSHYSFISVLLRCLLLLLSASSGSILLCSPQHVDLPLMTSNQSHDATHVGRINGNTMPFPFEVVKHDGIEVGPLLKGCSVLMLCIQILISFASICPDKELVCP